MTEPIPPEGGITTDSHEVGQNQRDEHAEHASVQTGTTTLPGTVEENWTYEKQLKVRH